ncbi:MAG: hypothetical protein U1A78_07080 [Polyangia bacterium]
MRVILSSELFIQTSRNLDVLALFQMGLEGRHRVEVEDELASAYTNWLAQRSSYERAECQTAISNSLSMSTLQPSAISVWVTGSGNSDWKPDEPRLCLQDALDLLRRPTRVLLEDSVTDRAFLSCFLSRQERRFIDEREQHGWLHFEHGGGVPKMRATILRSRRQWRWCHLNYFVLSDSDALQPGRPSKAVKELNKACGQKVKYHQLSRRSIENYLPRQALDWWKDRDSADRSRRTKVRAFFRMSEPQRHHYNMKEGLAGDRPRATAGESAGDLYAAIEQSDRDALAEGFGPNVADLFSSAPVTESDLRSDGSWPEMEPVVADLLTFLR